MALLTVGTFVAEPYLGLRPIESLKAASPFVLATIDNSTFSLTEENNGSVVILDFMATWCPPCADQAQELERVRPRYLPQAVKIVTIDVAYSEAPADLRAWRHHLYDPEDLQPYANDSREAEGWFYATDTTAELVGPSFNANALPTVVLIDAQGRIRQTWTGLVLAPNLEAALDIALGRPA